MAKESLRQIYFNPRMAALIGLGFASGLPNALPQDTLKAWLTAAGVDVKNIGLFGGLVVFPYVFKFLWAPLLDAYMPPVLGRRRGWLMIAQLGLALALLAIAMSGPTVAAPHTTAQPSTMSATVPVLPVSDSSLVLVGLAAIAVVFLSASQDIVADAYRADVLPREEMGVGAATFVMGYRIAMIVSGAGVFFLVKPIGWRGAYALMAALMGLMMLITWFVPEPPRAFVTPPTLKQAVVEPLREFFGVSVKDGVVLFAFIFLFKLPDVMSFSMAMPLLERHLHFSVWDIGAVRQFAGFWVIIAGSLIAGGILPHLGMIRSLWLFGVLQALSNLAYWWLAGHERNMTAFIVAVCIEHFVYGFVTAGLVAFMMSRCDRRYSAFQYAILSAIMAATGMVFSPLCGMIVSEVGYESFFFRTVLAGIPGLLVLCFLKERPANKNTVVA
jgi:PAT family beta-lactamase induction signal transducer AmpG